MLATGNNVRAEEYFIAIQFRADNVGGELLPNDKDDYLVSILNANGDPTSIFVFWEGAPASSDVTQQYSFDLPFAPSNYLIKIEQLNPAVSVSEWFYTGAGGITSQSPTEVRVVPGVGLPFLRGIVPSETRHPITAADFPPANTPAGAPVVWGPQSMTGGGMRLYSGDFTEQVTDLHVKGRGLDFVWARRYLSADMENMLPNGTTPALGNGWDHSYNIWAEALEVTGNFADKVGVQMGNGRKVTFGDAETIETGGTGEKTLRYKADGWAAELWYSSFSSFAGHDTYLQDILVQNAYVLRYDDGTVWTFFPTGSSSAHQIQKIEDRYENTLLFGYGDTNYPHRLTSIKDTLSDGTSRAYTIRYNETGENTGLIKEIEDFTGRKILYTYCGSSDSDGKLNDLKSVRYLDAGDPDTRTLGYTYYTGTDAKLAGKLLKIKDGMGEEIAVNTYGQVAATTSTYGRVTTQVLAHESLTPTINYTYASSSAAQGASKVTVVKDGAGNVSHHYFNNLNQLRETRDYTGRASDLDAPTGETTGNRPVNKLREGDPASFDTKFEWNQHDNLTKITEPKGQVITYAYLDEENPMKRGYVTTTTRSFTGLTSLITTNAYEVLSDGRVALLSFTDEASKVTAYVNFAHGKPEYIKYPLLEGQGAAINNETFAYNIYGQVTSHMLPASKNSAGSAFQRTDSYTYHSSGSETGYLETVKEDDGGTNLTTTFAYDAVGNVESVTDPKSNVWEYVYTNADDLKTVTSPVPGNGNSAAYVTTYNYDVDGNVLTVESPYVNDIGGNPVKDGGIPLDDNGKTVTKYLYDPMHRISAVIQDFEGFSTANANTKDTRTEYVYDANGNVIKTKSPLATGTSPAEPENIVEMAYDERDALFTRTGKVKLNRTGDTEFQDIVTRYDYDVNLNVEKVTVAYLNATASHPETQVTSYQYDAFNRPTLATLPDSTVAAITDYDLRGMPKTETVTGPRGNGTTGVLRTKLTGYDNRGRKNSEKINADPGSGAIWTYTDADQPDTATDPDGIATVHRYDTNYRPHVITDGAGNTVTYTYDANSNVYTVTQVDKDGTGGTDQTMTTTYAYDALDRVVHVDDPAGKDTYFYHDSFDNVVKTTDANGHFSRATYDAMSRLVEEARYSSSAVLGPKVSQAWDKNSRLISRSDPSVNITTYEYNTMNWPVATKYFNAGSTTTPFSFDYVEEYDRRGNVKRTNKNGRSTTAIDYDVMGRPTMKTTSVVVGHTPPPKATDLKPVVESAEYDGLSRTTKVGRIDSGVEKTTTFSFLDQQNPPRVEETQKIGIETPWTVARTYSHGGRLASLAYPSGKTLSFKHGDSGASAGQNGLLKKIAQGGGLPDLDYLYAGNRVARRTAAGKVRMDIGYVPAQSAGAIRGVVNTQLPSPGATLSNWSFTWDDVYNKASRSDNAHGSVLIGYGYNERNQLDAYTLNNGANQLSYALDISGNRTGGGFSLAASAFHQYSATPNGAALGYDADGSLFTFTNGTSDISQYTLTGNLAGQERLGTVLLDDMSALSDDFEPSEGSEWSADGKLEEHSGEDAPRLMRENVPANLESFMFSYQSPHDPAGLGANGNYLPNFYALALTRLGQDSVTGEWSYLALVIEPDRLYLAAWSADGQDTLGQPPAIVANTPGQWYDVHITFDGNLVSVQRGIYGGALQPLYTNVDVSAFSTHSDVSFGKGKAADYQFDDLRLQAETISALSASRRYEYDALGRRVLQTVLVDGVPVNTFFIYDGDRVIEEYRDREGGAHQLQARYVYGQYIDEVLQRELDLDNNGTPEVVHYYLHDDLYNVVGVTDSSGALVERYEYGEYGKPSIFQVPASGPEVEISASAIANRYMFNGREYDSGTGLYWYRTRYMDPEQGRFIARDTIGAWGDASNLGNPFAYVGNNPWSKLDPYGEYGANPMHSALLDYEMKYGSPGVPDFAKRLAVTTGIVAVNVGAWCGGPALGLTVNGITLAGGTGYSAYSRNEQWKAYTGESPTWGQLGVAVAGDVSLVSAGYTLVTGEDAFVGTQLSSDEYAEFVTHMAIGAVGGVAGGRAGMTYRAAANRATMQSAVGEAMARRAVLPRQPRAYTAAFEVELPQEVWGKSEKVHYNRANYAVDEAMRASSEFAALMEDAVPGIGRSVSKSGRRKLPENWTWEHTSSSTAQGRFGVMRLVPRVQHTAGSRWWRVIHPNEGAAGGYAEWAVPAGAPPRKTK